MRSRCWWPWVFPRMRRPQPWCRHQRVRLPWATDGWLRIVSSPVMALWWLCWLLMSHVSLLEISPLQLRCRSNAPWNMRTTMLNKPQHIWWKAQGAGSTTASVILGTPNCNRHMDIHRTYRVQHFFANGVLHIKMDYDHSWLLHFFQVRKIRTSHVYSLFEHSTLWNNDSASGHL